jgi:ABC-type antimicrobial peptide transport system permease subunit
MGAFGLMAVSLAVIGIYSVMSYYVTERTREIASASRSGLRCGTCFG